MLAIIIELLKLPVDECSLRLGAALQKHTAVLHTIHTPVFHTASQAVHIIYSNPNTHRHRNEKCVAKKTRQRQKECVNKVPWCWRSEHWERGSPFRMSCRLVRLGRNQSVVMTFNGTREHIHGMYWKFKQHTFCKIYQRGTWNMFFSCYYLILTTRGHCYPMLFHIQLRNGVFIQPSLHC